MALIEISTAPTDTIDVANDYIPFVDVSETPDGTNKATFASIFGQNLVDIRALADPNADRLLFWDDSAGAYTHLTLGTNLSITGTTINAAGGGIGGSTGATDNAILRADGTGGSTAQNSPVTIGDQGEIVSTGADASLLRLLSIRNTNAGGLSALAFYDSGGAEAARMQYNNSVPALSFLNLGFAPIYFVTNGVVRMTIEAGGLCSFSHALEMTEITAPAAPAANGCRLYLEDNGSGKTRLMALFSSGSAQQLAIQP